MRETRIEILKDGLWQALRLEKDAVIKYNAVINKIGKVATREISHTNTFSLPHVHHNLQVLGLNIFNPKELAKAMNTKYVAKYYVEDKLLQSGFIVINNTNEGKINVNFIDESLSLVEKWGSMTFQELLQDEILEFPTDYATAISELRDYDMDKTALLTKLPQVGTRGYALCSFPNNLNTIGDKFQLDENELRQDDVFNPYQSRPLFNVKSLFDLATESFGYTPIYDNSVDWDLVQDTFIVNDGQDQNEEGDGGLSSFTYPTMSVSNYIFLSYNSTFGNYEMQVPMIFPTSVGIAPNSLTNFPNDPYGVNVSQTSKFRFFSNNTIFVPNVSEGNAGTVRFQANDNYNVSSVIYTTETSPLNPNANSLTVDVTKTNVSKLIISSTNITDVTNTSFHLGVETFTTTEDVILIMRKYFYTTVGSEKVVLVESQFNMTTNVFGRVVTDIDQNSSRLSEGIGQPIEFEIEALSSQPLGSDFEISSYYLNYELINNTDRFIHYEDLFIDTQLNFDLGRRVVIIYEDTTVTNGYIFEEATFSTNDSNSSVIDITIDKSQFDSPTHTNAGSVVGLYVLTNDYFYTPGTTSITNIIVTETFLAEGVVAFDKYGQFLPDDVDLSYNAPRKSIKSLLSACMHKEGILMDINAKDKTVKFFNYGEYENQKNSSNFSDWSKYLLKYNGFIHNTDYGTSYAKKNRIGLSEPFKGNTYDIILENQGLNSKYKDFTEDSVSMFKDVSNVLNVNNTNTPYFEYTNEGLGLVELQGTLGTLEQERANGSSEGNFTGLDQFANVNYVTIPKGVELWYSLIDESIRVEAKFLLPVNVMRDLDLSEPIYVEELGGFYIIEEIKEYSNQHTPVNVKLIKLPQTTQVTLTSFSINSSPKETSAFACLLDFTEDTMYHNGASSNPIVGDIVYSTNDINSPFNGGGSFYYIGGYSLQIDSSGEVLDIISC